jgi:hypothetical protein
LQLVHWEVVALVHVTGEMHWMIDGHDVHGPGLLPR